LKHKKHICRVLILIIILISLLFSSSCARFIGNSMPSLYIEKNFENDTWLVIDNKLINKKTGEVCCIILSEDDVVKDGLRDILTPYTYKIDFFQDNFKLYAFLSVDVWDQELKQTKYTYYERAITIGYDGREISREYLGNTLNDEQFDLLYSQNYESEEFSYNIDYRWMINTSKPNSASKQKILEYAQKIYEEYKKTKIVGIKGLAKPINDKFWFSITSSDLAQWNSGVAQIAGAKKTEIKSYDPKTDEIETVFEYNRKKTIIVDFDQDGFYTFDSKSNLKYYDFKTKKSTLIHKFSGHAVMFEVTDKYICTFVRQDDDYYFVYEKSGKIIANSKYDNNISRLLN